MPEQIYTGLTDWYYPATRDARDIPLGTVEPDDIRDLDEAPDRMWRPVTDEDRERIAAKKAAADAPQDQPEDEDSSGTDEADDDPPPPASTPPGPVPAPPAIIPTPAENTPNE